MRPEFYAARTLHDQFSLFFGFTAARGSWIGATHPKSAAQRIHGSRAQAVAADKAKHGTIIANRCGDACFSLACLAARLRGPCVVVPESCSAGSRFLLGSRDGPWRGPMHQLSRL